MSTLLYNQYRVKWSTKGEGVEKVPKTVYIVCVRPLRKIFLTYVSYPHSKFKWCTIEIKTDLQRICTIYPNANYRCMCVYCYYVLYAIQVAKSKI